MKKFAVIATLIASSSLFSASVFAQEPTFEKEFVQRTILGNWEPGAHAVSNDTPNVDAAAKDFTDSIFSRYPRVTDESRNQGNASAELFTRQFK